MALKVLGSITLHNLLFHKKVCVLKIFKSYNVSATTKCSFTTQFTHFLFKKAQKLQTGLKHCVSGMQIVLNGLGDSLKMLYNAKMV